MKHRVNSYERRKVQLVGDRTDTLQYLKWPEELEGELLIGPRHQGGLDIGLQLKVNSVSHLEHQLRMALVSLMFHSVLSTGQMLADQSLHNFPFMHPRQEVQSRTHCRRVNAELPWSMAVEDLKWRSTERQM